MDGLSDKGQMIILFSLVVAGIIASLSALHAQNVLAGMETSRTLMVFPKEEIRNLKDIAENDIHYVFFNYKLDKGEFYRNFTDSLKKQLNLLYAQRGVYAELTVFRANQNVSYNVQIVYLSQEIEYNETMLCRRGGCV
ncbi:MAG: hypothetical protein DRO98_02565 [Archaeoglobales archaeon]|nr:MAG: hypothetical protein DRO98_02565 [Archaeoglobales archaeon]